MLVSWEERKMSEDEVRQAQTQVLRVGAKLMELLSIAMDVAR